MLLDSNIVLYAANGTSPEAEELVAESGRRTLS
jgi:hypothetical protein